MNTLKTPESIGTVSLRLALVSFLLTLIMPPIIRRIPHEHIGFPMFLVYTVSTLVTAVMSIGIGSLPNEWRTRKGQGSICLGIAAVLMYVGAIYVRY